MTLGSIARVCGCVCVCVCVSLSLSIPFLSKEFLTLFRPFVPCSQEQQGFGRLKVPFFVRVSLRDPRGTTLPEALRGNLLLKGVLGGICRGLFKGKAVGFRGSPRDFPKVFPVVSLLGEAKPGVPSRGVSHFFRERSRLCRGPFRDCSS